MHRLERSLDADSVFTMLSEEQLHSAPGSREIHREVAPAIEGPGIAGVLSMQIAHELGTIDSMSRCRIVTTKDETLIAQLTETALRDSPVRGSDLRLTLRVNVEAGSATVDRHRAGPVVGERGPNND